MGNQATSFGIGGVAVFAADGSLANFSEVTGAFNADLSFPLVDVMAGPYRLPVDALQGRGEGGFTLTLNERPDWVDIVSNQAILTLLDGAETYAVNNLKGAPDMKVADNAANDRAKPGLYYIKATGADTASVMLTNADGTREYAVAAVGVAVGNAVEIGDTSLKIYKAAAGDWNVGDAVSVLVLGYSAAKPVSRLQYPSQGIRVPDYSLVVFTAGNANVGNSVRVLDLPRVKFAGNPFTVTDNEPNVGTEISGKILVPDGGGFFGVQYQIPVEAA